MLQQQKTPERDWNDAKDNFGKTSLIGCNSKKPLKGIETDSTDVGFPF